MSDGWQKYYEGERHLDQRCPKCGSTQIGPSDYDPDGGGIGVECFRCGYDSLLGEYGNRPFFPPGVIGTHDKMEDYGTYKGGE